MFFGTLIGGLGVGRATKKSNGNEDVVAAIRELGRNQAEEQDKTRKAIYETSKDMGQRLERIALDQRTLLARGEHHG